MGRLLGIRGAERQRLGSLGVRREVHELRERRMKKRFLLKGGYRVLKIRTIPIPVLNEKIQARSKVKKASSKQNQYHPTNDAPAQTITVKTNPFHIRPDSILTISPPFSPFYHSYHHQPQVSSYFPPHYSPQP